MFITIWTVGLCKFNSLVVIRPIDGMFKLMFCLGRSMRDCFRRKRIKRNQYIFHKKKWGENKLKIVKLFKYYKSSTKVNPIIYNVNFATTSHYFWHFAKTTVTLTLFSPPLVSSDALLLSYFLQNLKFLFEIFATIFS